MATRRLIGWAILVLVVGGLLVYGLSPKSSSPGGRKAPALPHEHLVGSPQTLSGLITADGGRPVAVVFWASWCGPCASEAPEIERFATSAAGRGRIVGVDWSDGLSGARSFVRRYGWTFTTLRDAEGTVGNEYSMTVLPTTFIVNGHERIVAVLRGPQTQASLQSALAKAS